MHSLPTHRVQKTIDTKEPPHEVIVWGALCRSRRKLRWEPTAEGGVVRSDIRVPELCEGGCPCRSEDEHRRPHNR